MLTPPPGRVEGLSPGPWGSAHRPIVGPAHPPRGSGATTPEVCPRGGAGSVQDSSRACDQEGGGCSGVREGGRGESRGGGPER